MPTLRRLAPLSLALASLAGGCSTVNDLGAGDTAASGAESASAGYGTAGEGESAGDPGGEAGGGTSEPDISPEPGQLTAGEWRDLDHWSFWLGLFSRPDIAAYAEQWGFITTARYPVIVRADGKPLADAGVTLLGPDEKPLWSARTDAHGEAELFAGIFDGVIGESYKVSVSSSAGLASADATRDQPVVVEVTGAAQPKPALDLMFVIDTTGSMGDELSYLQSELADVIDRVRTNVGETVALRLSVNFYRDDGDEYLVRPFPFTTDIDAALVDLEAQTADGGGDWPEAVHSALADAVDQHAWSETATARLCFLVLDAPPHEDEATLASVRTSVGRFAEKGVRAIPIAASGVDQPTEFLLRFFAVATGGTYTFLTDDSGIGGEHTEPTIGDYELERLNDLLVRVITESLTP